jgi:hypothetical protein
MLTKRKNYKNGYWSVTYDDNGKIIGKTKWHGTNEKGVSSNAKAQRITEYKVLKELSKKEIPVKEWREQGYAIPRNTAYVPGNQTMHFHYIVKINGEDADGNPMSQQISALGDRPLTRSEIGEKVKKYAIESYEMARVKSFNIQRLNLNHGSNHKYHTNYPKTGMEKSQLNRR